MDTAPVLTINDLVANEALSLKVVVAGNLATRVRGVHTMEIDQPSRWLEPGWLMLTTGLRFTGADDVRAQTELITELRGAKVAGLAFGVGVHFQLVPPALVEAAREADFTLLTVAAEVPFMQIESFVNRSLASAETYLVKRALWLQNDLLSALASAHPLTSLVNRVGHLIKGIAIVYDEDGNVITSTGPGPQRLIWDGIRAREPRRQRFVVGRWQVTSRPTVLGGLSYWIAIGSLREGVIDDLGGPILDSVQRLMGVIRSERAVHHAHTLTEAEELLTALRGALEPAELPRLWDRLTNFRFQPQTPVRAFVSVELPPSTPPEPTTVAAMRERHRNHLAEEAQSNGLPVIFRPREPDAPEGLIGLAPDMPVLHEWIDQLGSTQHVGVSEPFTDLSQARRSFRDAARAALVAQRRALQRIALARGSSATNDAPGSGPTHGTVVRFEDVDLATWLLSSRSAEAIEGKATQQLGELLRREDLADTAVAYLAANLNVHATATRLFMHPNSVRYRLRQIEEIVDGPLSAPSILANLYLAFHDRLAADAASEPPSAPDDAGGSTPTAPMSSP